MTTDIHSLLQSAEPGDRVSGVNRLNTLPHEEAMVLVQPLIVDENARVRYSAVSKLATIGKVDLALTLTLLRERLRNDPELDVKAAAADSLGALQLVEAYDDLAEFYYATGDWILKMSIVAALSEMAEPRAIEVLRDALTNDNDLIVTMAVGAIGELGAIEAIEDLTPFTQHPDTQVRFRVAQALGHLGGDRAKELLTAMLNDADAQVVEQVQLAIASL